MAFEFEYACGKCGHEAKVCARDFAVGPQSSAPEKAFRALMTYEPTVTDRLLMRTDARKMELLAAFEAAHEEAGNLLHRLRCPYCDVRVTVPKRVTQADLQRWQEREGRKMTYPFVEKLVAQLRAAAGGEMALPAVACPSCERSMETDTGDATSVCPKCGERAFAAKPGSPVAYVEQAELPETD